MIIQATGLPRHATKVWSRRTSPPSLVCIHHSATHATVMPEAMARYHVREKDRPGIAYHYVIGPQGTIWWCNDDDLFTFHGNGHNVGIGVCLVGNFTSAPPTAAQLESARWLYHELRRRYGDLPLVGHNTAAGAATECPGKTWQTWRHRIEEERIEMQTTKICPHILESYSGTLGKPPVVKVVNPSFEYLRQLRQQIGPEPMLIARWTVDGEPWAEWMRAPEYWAQRWVDMHRATIHACVEAGLNVAFEGANEVPDELSAAYSRHELRRVEILHAIGARAIVGNWAVGNPEMCSMCLFEPVLSELRHGDAVGIHWYWADEENLLANIQGTPWHNRAVLGGWLRDSVIVYTEGGRDYLPDINRGGPWQRTTNITQYLKEWRITDDWLCSQGNTVGMTAYTIGRVLDEKWRQYMCDSFWPSIVAGQQPWVPTWAKYWPGSVTLPGNADDDAIARAVVDMAHDVVLPLNRDAALYKAAVALGEGLVPASDEFEPLDGIVAQSFRRADDDRVIYTAWTRKGEWAPEQVRWIEHAN